MKAMLFKSIDISIWEVWVQFSVNEYSDGTMTVRDFKC